MLTSAQARLRALGLPSFRRAARAAARRHYLAVRRGLSATFVDARRGTETSHEVNLASLGLADPHRVRYEPSGWLDLRRALRPGEVSRHDTFVDLGSGKGRVVLQAARYPFGRVIGVELSSELNEVAARNVAASRDRQRCTSIELVTCDVAKFRIPDDVTVAYIYNAFRGPVFAAVIDALIASADRAPRRIRLIYRTALEHDRVMETGRFRLTRVARGLRPGRSWSRKMAIRVYELESPSPP